MRLRVVKLAQLDQALEEGVVLLEVFQNVVNVSRLLDKGGYHGCHGGLKPQGLLVVVQRIGSREKRHWHVRVLTVL